MGRLNHLDALRSAAMLIVVVFHLTIGWPDVISLSGSTTAALEWTLAATRWSLALFFLMAGFFGGRLIRHWGAKRFVADRLRRVALPLLVGVAAILPLGVAIASWVKPGLVVVPAPAHLWFLWYVLVLYAAGLLILRAPGVKRLATVLDRLTSASLAVPVLTAVSTALLLISQPFAVQGAVWLLPQPALLLFYGSFFVVGLLLHDTSRGLDALGRRPLLWGAVAAAALVPLVLLDRESVWGGPGVLIHGAESFGWLALYSLFSWAAVCCVCGLGQRLLAAERPAVRYVADASYWAYLMHFPLVPLVIVAATSLPLPFPVAWLLALTLLSSMLLVSYELLVRHTIVGRTLNGPRPPRRWGPGRGAAAGLPEGASR